MRALVAALLAANLGYLAWTAFGGHGEGPREPERLGRQLQPEALRLLSAEEARAFERRNGVPAACLEAGPFADDRIEAAERSLRNAVPGVTAGRVSRVAAASGQMLRVDAADAALQAQLLGLAEPAFGEQRFERCGG